MNGCNQQERHLEDKLSNTLMHSRIGTSMKTNTEPNFCSELWNGSSRMYQVVVIGAGMAGLGAALTLYENGYENIKILEAQEEPGGRIKTIALQSGFIDLGAQWIHGTDNNCLYRIAKKHNLLSEEMSEEGCGLYVRDDGYVFDTALVKEVNFQLGKIVSECEKFTNESTFPYSFGNFLEDKFQKYIQRCKDLNEVMEMKKELFDWHVKFLLVDNSCSTLENVSAKEWGKYIDEPEHINLKNGYKSLVDLLISMLPSEILRCNCPLSKVIWSNDKDYIKLQCSNGETIYCDHVIVTTSLGVLKDIQNFFQPCLPDKLQRSINSMGFYGIAKIFLIFEYKWWNTNGFQLIWRRNTKITGVKSWTKFITGFDSIYNQPNVLLGWVSGEGVPTMEKLSESEVGLHCIDLLQHFLNMFVPNPTKVIRTKWMSSPWVRGAYSHITPQCDETYTGPSTLSEPVIIQGVPRVLLAGEACNPKHFSTTHGAFESGQAQAQILVDFLK